MILASVKIDEFILFQSGIQEPFSSLITQVQIRRGDFLPLHKTVQLSYAENDLIFNCAAVFYENFLCSGVCFASLFLFVWRMKSGSKN